MNHEQLKSSTVKLNINGSQGTGFFVASGLILTCAHVVKGAANKPIKIWWQNQEYTATIYKLPEEIDTIDLALLKVKTILEHPIVILDIEVKLGDKIYNFGYPDQNLDGDPSTFEYIDTDGKNPPLFKFKEGLVRPGLSGSPLLNLRTGKVCGIIKSTLDRNIDIGGRGVPSSVIFGVFPELERQHKSYNNPFIPRSGIIKDVQLIFDRDREIKEIFETLNSGSSVVLIGENAIGKSSLLQAVLRQAENELKPPRKPVYLNLEEVINANDFYYALCDRVGIPCDYNKPLKGYLLSRALEKYRILLLLDGIENMTWEGFTNQVRSQLRGLASKDSSEAPLRLVIAAKRSLTQLFADSGLDSPFEGICREIKINLWEEVQIRQFIDSRLVKTPIRFTEEEIIQLIQESKGHPQRLMESCYQTYKGYLK